jgi:hypothetical protein
MIRRINQKMRTTGFSVCVLGTVFSAIVIGSGYYMTNYSSNLIDLDIDKVDQISLTYDSFWNHDCTVLISRLSPNEFETVGSIVDLYEGGRKSIYHSVIKCVISTKDLGLLNHKLNRLGYIHQTSRKRSSKTPMGVVLDGDSWNITVLDHNGNTILDAADTGKPKSDPENDLFMSTCAIIFEVAGVDFELTKLKRSNKPVERNAEPLRSQHPSL